MIKVSVAQEEGRGTELSPLPVGANMALTAVDRELLNRCLKRDTGAWNDFVDRFLGLIYHVIQYTAYLRSHPLTPEEVEDIAQEVMLQIVANEYAVLKQFRGGSSLSAYLTVIARRICAQQLAVRRKQAKSSPSGSEIPAVSVETPPAAQAGLESLEQVQRLLKKLPSRERQIVKMFYLEGRSYEEISTQMNIPVNTIGPILARARKKLRGDEASAPPPSQKSRKKANASSREAKTTSGD
jgi:RNA polymerase sigma-70 factor (ECF subfamily)